MQQLSLIKLETEWNRKRKKVERTILRPIDWFVVITQAQSTEVVYKCGSLMDIHKRAENANSPSLRDLSE